MLRSFYTCQYRVVVDRCISCNLLWFDREELDLLQVMVEESVADRETGVRRLA
jgi:Zn-finger nucleic acid-binding protein